ncbi:FtsK/SpoIIIE domain-containing protein [Singulisphaera sp. PoT]|uniref:FtsK/SpoIIIE domain-containing protein n=1 Tax=Singulisphaera sp. PoT TaxID=3411797 RepID=UPI003BF54DE8
MSDTTLLQKEVDALQTLERASAERAKAESDTERGYRIRKQTEETSFQEALATLTKTGKAEIEGTEARYRAVRAELKKKYEAEKQTTEAEYAEVRRKSAAKANSAKKSAKKLMEETRWQILAVFESAKESVVKRHKKREADMAAALEHFEVIKDDSHDVMALGKKYGLTAAPAPETSESTPAQPAEAAATTGEAEGENQEAPEPKESSPLSQLIDVLKKADEQLEPLNTLKLPKFLRPQQFIWPFVVLGAVLAGGLAFGANLGLPIGAGAGVVIAIVVAVGIRSWLSGLARKHVQGLYPQFAYSLEEAERLIPQAQDWIKATFENQKIEIEQKRESDSNKAEEKFNVTSEVADERSAEEIKLADEKYPAMIKDIEKRRTEDIQKADDRYPKKIAELKEKLVNDTNQLHENYRIQKESTEKLYADTWKKLTDRWQEALDHVQSNVDDVNNAGAELFLDWHNTAPDDWTLPKAVPPTLQFGRFRIDMKDIPQGVTTDPRLKGMAPESYSLPAMVPFPTQASLLIRASDTGKVEAAQLLQSMMLRYATSIPAGKVRFTIIDPVSLGEHFAAFMHLADYSPLLVNDRIWTETSHIEQRLTDLQAHMENVIQKYLRNEFETIEDYNIHAGEVAEPFRILVVSNFPANFNESATRRLFSIASSGARCGVFTLISVDTKLPLPSSVQLKDLEPYAVNLAWKEQKFQWRDPNFGRLPLQLDKPPSSETFTRLMHIVGEAARNANRVEVPFDFIAPKPHEYWTGNTAKGVDVPLGRAGATKLQHMKLGKGTSQHVLIAGKTGSGKSTLLHALIMNAALRYSPDELQLYLIDFKKGVEFKVYAAMELPHAKVIAVESEREFGLSVLQRLDLELKVRGDRFRDLGVQDLNGYRQLEGQPPLPRILFIVDEFQEFFVEDDKIAQDVGLLLDRLVRQGRAFGVHVNLGSQSLGGAYSLARSTLGQMAVRIALQCSESDSNLILSEDNSAARLLTRPGEAIYNDQNGTVEGNNFFQVVWLSDSRREEYLEDLQALAKAQNRPPTEQIVFEGNLPAVPARNHLLAGLLQAEDWPTPPKADTSWLGEAIAIKDPTAAVFRPQSGSNLLIVGQNGPGALGIMITSLVSIAAQHVPVRPSSPAVGARFYVFDGTPVDSSAAGTLGRLADVIPHPIRDVSWREVKSVIAEIAGEVDRRQSEIGETPPIYLFIYDLQRFRDLRKSEDDFGFSSRSDDKALPTAKLFANILRDGPPVNIHTIIWCDSLNNLNRTFDRQGLKEFEIRVLFQMSANDSSSLIDSPAAGKLGELRALFFSEEEGKLEKFRPYGVPEDTEWYDYVRDRMRNRPNGAPQAPFELTQARAGAPDAPAPAPSPSYTDSFEAPPSEYSAPPSDLPYGFTPIPRSTDADAPPSFDTSDEPSVNYRSLDEMPPGFARIPRSTDADAADAFDTSDEAAATTQPSFESAPPVSNEPRVVAEDGGIDWAAIYNDAVEATKDYNTAPPAENGHGPTNGHGSNGGNGNSGNGSAEEPESRERAET